MLACVLMRTLSRSVPALPTLPGPAVSVRQELSAAALHGRHADLWRHLRQAAGLREPPLRGALPPRQLPGLLADGDQAVPVRQQGEGGTALSSEWTTYLCYVGPVCPNVNMRVEVQKDPRLSEASLQQEVRRITSLRSVLLMCVQMLPRPVPAMRAELWQDAQLQEPQMSVPVPPRPLLPLPGTRRQPNCTQSVG